MTTGDYVNIIDAYHMTGSYRAAALVCGATHKTVPRVVDTTGCGRALGATPATAASQHRRGRQPDRRPGQRHRWPHHHHAAAAGGQGAWL